MTTLVFAVLAGMGAGAAWGYRTALYVALGRMTPPAPRAARAALAVPLQALQREEATR